MLIKLCDGAKAVDVDTNTHYGSFHLNEEGIYFRKSPLIEGDLPEGVIVEVERILWEVNGE
ncbi:hypothetical protein NVP1170O_179 [Vibrio phage 1.170.O._10N.261.52.C3]|nr:hypothetical protein NVP1170O_179 [Vibrio phage 1.170.O._10N.261.52.C3]